MLLEWNIFVLVWEFSGNDIDIILHCVLSTLAGGLCCYNSLPEFFIMKVCIVKCGEICNIVAYILARVLLKTIV